MRTLWISRYSTMDSDGRRLKLDADMMSLISDDGGRIMEFVLGWMEADIEIEIIRREV
ncbi:hypothetical protein TSUD_365790 [Trifolium subterraneum]|uniref:Uncharacterized protein n=1 Tax=Trifolium subterraneum TaxID=3900 RepID=A0A2Z6PF82_TRISU|nr:hypothetical protein TSUD_365790 [Trifolium subterraneum]